MLTARQKVIAGVSLAAVVVLVVVLIATRKRREGYTRGCLENNCSGFNRTPVDYAFRAERSPEFYVKPTSTRQPLAEGNPVDFYNDERKLGTKQMYAQYRNDWAGCGADGLTTIRNDSKNRRDLVDVGELGLRRIMESEPSPLFGPEGVLNTEAQYTVFTDPSAITYTGAETPYGGSHVN